MPTDAARPRGEGRVSGDHGPVAQPVPALAGRSVAPRCGRRVRSQACNWPRPAPDQLPVRLLGRLERRPLEGSRPGPLRPGVPEGAAKLEPPGRSGQQLEPPDLVSGERGRALEVVRVLGQQVPGDHRELAGHVDDRDAGPAAPADPVVERPQWARCPDRRVGGLDEQRPGMGLARPADVPWKS